MRTNITQLDPVAREIPLVATVGLAWDMVKKEHVIEARPMLSISKPTFLRALDISRLRRPQGTRSEDPALRLLHVKEFPLI